LYIEKHRDLHIPWIPHKCKTVVAIPFLNHTLYISRGDVPVEQVPTSTASILAQRLFNATPAGLWDVDEDKLSFH
jgi:hypothetical protein